MNIMRLFTQKRPFVLGILLALGLFLGLCSFAPLAGASSTATMGTSQASHVQGQGFDTVTTTTKSLVPSASTTVAVLPLPAGSFVVDAIVPVEFGTPHSIVSCHFAVTNGFTDGPIPATAIASAPTPGGGIFGFQTLPLTDSITINAGGGTVAISCSLTKNVGPTPAATVLAGASITADQKTKLTFEPQP